MNFLVFSGYIRMAFQPYKPICDEEGFGTREESAGE